MMTILIVDDSDVDIKLTQAIIRREGIECDFLTASTGEEGIKTLESKAADLAIVDILMPGLDGFETCRKIKEMKPDMKVIILTGIEEELHPQKIRYAGADLYTTKKLIDYTLVKAIKKVMNLS
jgi:CheY-like chemotaxis protein